MPGRSVKAAVAAVAAAVALAGCGGSPKTGTAAVVGDDRITVSELSDTVRDWREQFRTDPVANELRSHPGFGLAGGPDSDLQRALALLINFRVNQEAAQEAGVEITGGQVDGVVEMMNRQGGAESQTLAQGLPREHTRDLARMVAIQAVVMQRFGADPDGRPSPQTRQAVQRWSDLLRRTAAGMDIEINPRYGEFDPSKLVLDPVAYRLSSPDSGI